MLCPLERSQSSLWPGFRIQSFPVLLGANLADCLFVWCFFVCFGGGGVGQIELFNNCMTHQLSNRETGDRHTPITCFPLNQSPPHPLILWSSDPLPPIIVVPTNLATYQFPLLIFFTLVTSKLGNCMPSLKAGLHVRRKHGHKHKRKHKPRVNRDDASTSTTARSFILRLCLPRPGLHVACAYARACVVRVNQP